MQKHMYTTRYRLASFRLQISISLELYRPLRKISGQTSYRMIENVINFQLKLLGCNLV